MKKTKMTKTKTKKSKTLAKRPATEQLSTAEQGARFFKGVAQEVATAIEKGTVGLLYNDLSTWKDGFARLHKLANDAGRQQILDHGAPRGEKGSRALVLPNGMVWELRRARGGDLDPKKYEALLRAKAHEAASDTDDFLAKYMLGRVVYELDADHTQRALTDKVITPEELEACHSEPSYALQRPRKVEDFDVVDAEAGNE